MSLFQGRLNNVVADISLTEAKDVLPTGYSPVDVTVDSRECVCRDGVPTAVKVDCDVNTFHFRNW